MKVSGAMPDVTPAQTVAVVSWIVAQAVAFGYLDIRYQQVAVSAGATVLAAVWKLADAWIRNGRAHAVAANPSLVVPVAPPKA